MEFSKQDIKKELSVILPKEDIYIDEPMSKHTTFKIGGNADVFVKVRNEEQILKIVKFCNENNIPMNIVGNGSNLLVRDNGIRGIVAKMCMDSYHFIDECTVNVEAGMLNAKLARILMENELTGFEFASGIPGTIGGAIRMNAGAYGGEIKDIVVSSMYLDLDDGKKKVIDNEEHCFEYRNSIFSKKNAIILETVLRLKKGEKEKIEAKMAEISESRKEKQPIDKPSAGSSFKRGSDFVTAKLIDEAGLKGMSIGGAEISNKHAGFIVNNGNATADDVLELTKLVQEKIWKKYGKKVELEIEVLGEE